MTLATEEKVINQKETSISFCVKKLNKGTAECEAMLGDKVICSCKVNSNISMWTIVSWFTNEEFQGNGIGKKTLAQTLYCLYKNTGAPKEIKYIWNGMNSYVLEWMERHFDAKSLCPIAVQKKQADDDWESHIYDLDVAKTLAYFEIV